MPRFRYIAIDPSSTTVNGRIEASSQSAVVDHLRAAGQMPLSIEEMGTFPSISGVELAALFRRRMPRQTLTLITGQLATLLQAGLALDEALESLADLVERRSERGCVRAVRDRVSGGASLADAMGVQPEVFPDFYVSMVRAGEAGGSLETVLERLADFLERSDAAREHIKSALIYPLFLAFTCIASIIVLFTFVVPRFRPVFAEAGGALPLAARILLRASEIFQNFWWLAIVLPVGLAFLLRLQFKRSASRARWDRLVLRLPVAGALIGQVEVVRFSRTLGTLLKNGVSMMTALAITHETVSNRVFHEAVTRIIERVRIGRGLAEPFAEAQIFPRIAVQLVRVGEESGRQEEMLLKIADILEGETRRNLDRVLALIGPAVMIGLGVVVAGVISTILTAILSVYGLAR
jgi:general secretion pathway protein F